MYLKEIKSLGFKSFADKINIELSKGITGIVGPNGSGKSNIVDAIRWVLGEQSIKSLRGDNAMTDVIFSGSKSRNSSGSASVTLVFDNSDKYLKTPYTEVEIRRRVYKDGTNEYFLNNERCRLKDITDILLDSGIAKESFNIISQGKIDEIISTKPTDRRIIFEEAAGVLKYKRRKEEALRKLEKTHDNISRADDIINELEQQVMPLKEQKEKALKYQELNEKLTDIEISLITNDIKEMNQKYTLDKEKIEVLNNEILSLSTNNTNSEAKISEYKIKINELDDKIQSNQKKLINLTTDLEKINTRKQLIIERQKYETDDIKLHNNAIELKEEELKLINEINNNKTQKEELSKNYENILKELEQLNSELDKIKTNKQIKENNLKDKIKINNNLKMKIESLSSNNIPFATKNILESNFKGIHNTFINLIEIDNTYSLAITTSLGSVTNNIIIDNEIVASTIINYLKKNNMGRVTMFPLNIIKPKYVDSSTIDNIKNIQGFIDIASNLVKCDKIYNDIILNQLGNVLVVDNITNANIISKKINYRYKIVTLDGNLIHVGGSITGGSNIKNSKLEKENTEQLLDKNIKEIKNIENDINEIDYNFKSIEDKIYLLEKNKLNIKENISIKENLLSNLTNKLELTTNNIKDTTNLLNKVVTNEEENIIKEYYNLSKEKDNLNNLINKLLNEKNDLNESLEQYEYSLRKENTSFNSKNKELKNLEIEVNRLDVKLDMLLNSLNETYNLTYEKAREDYILTMDDNIARNLVTNLKNEISSLGDINISSINEYKRVSERYEFLIKQKEDLINAENILLNIIKEMDEVMKKEFIKTFKIIREKFNETFVELFKGGSADLKLTDPNNILETGIEIIAMPPGKKLSTISLLSGGEKTFTAISLLFAILKSREVPFCILDEVEAALDEANVNSFGEYINNLKNKTQFILITHKKKTMEFVDTLYGITMQESGVSKLVSVRLEEIGE